MMLLWNSARLPPFAKNNLFSFDLSMCNLQPWFFFWCCSCSPRCQLRFCPGTREITPSSGTWSATLCLIRCRKAESAFSSVALWGSPSLCVLRFGSRAAHWEHMALVQFDLQTGSCFLSGVVFVWGAFLTTPLKRWLLSFWISFFHTAFVTFLNGVNK